MGTDAKPEISFEAKNLINRVLERVRDATTARPGEAMDVLLSESIAQEALELYIAELERLAKEQT